MKDDPLISDLGGGLDQYKELPIHRTATRSSSVLSGPMATSSLGDCDPTGVDISHNEQSLQDNTFHKKAANDYSYKRKSNLCVETDATATSTSGLIIPADFDGVRDSLMLLKTKGRPRYVVYF
jgi:hypothetical protein